jgi:hypothetical protein
VVFAIKEHLIDATAIIAIQVEVTHHYRATDLVIVYLKVLAANLHPEKLHSLVKSASFLVGVTAPKHNGHIFRIELNLRLQRPLRELEDQLLLRCGLVLILEHVSFHEINQVHESVYFFQLET